MLNEELKNKLKECKTEEEMEKILEAEGIELDPDQLEKVSGGGITMCRPNYKLSVSPTICKFNEDDPLA